MDEPLRHGKLAAQTKKPRHGDDFYAITGKKGQAAYKASQ
jgi:hypothetical protein